MENIIEFKKRPTPEEIISRVEASLDKLKQEESEIVAKLKTLTIDQQSSNDDRATQNEERELHQKTLETIRESIEEAEHSLSHIEEHGLVCGIPGCGKDIETDRLLADEFPLACTKHREQEEGFALAA